MSRQKEQLTSQEEKRGQETRRDKMGSSFFFSSFIELNKSRILPEDSAVKKGVSFSPSLPSLQITLSSLGFCTDIRCLLCSLSLSLSCLSGEQQFFLLYLCRPAEGSQDICNQGKKGVDTGCACHSLKESKGSHLKRVLEVIKRCWNQSRTSF